MDFCQLRFLSHFLHCLSDATGKATQSREISFPPLYSVEYLAVALASLEHISAPILLAFAAQLGVDRR
jgi:hypothetical protein